MLARRQFVKHDAEREDVRGGIHRLGPRLFRGHVEDGPDARARVRARPGGGGDLARQAEVEHFHEAVAADH